MPRYVAYHPPPPPPHPPLTQSPKHKTRPYVRELGAYFFRLGFCFRECASSTLSTLEFHKLKSLKTLSNPKSPKTRKTLKALTTLKTTQKPLKSLKTQKPLKSVKYLKCKQCGSPQLTGSQYAEVRHWVQKLAPRALLNRQLRLQGLGFRV